MSNCNLYFLLGWGGARVGGNVSLVRNTRVKPDMNNTTCSDHTDLLLSKWKHGTSTRNVNII